MHRSVGRNYVFNMLYQILLIILPVITTPYISRVLEPSGVGIYNYTCSVVSAFSLVAVLGSNSFAIREVAYVQGDKERCSVIFYEILAFRVMTTALILPWYVGFFLVSGKYIEVHIASIIYLVSVPFDISWFFQGLEEFKKIIIASGLMRIMGAALIFLLIKSPDDTAKYTLIMAMTGLLSSVLLWRYLPKYINKFDRNRFKPWGNLKAILCFFIPALSTYIYTSLDKIVLGVMSTEEEVGYYSQSEKIIKLLITVIVSLSTVLMPRMANLIKTGKMDLVKNNLNKSYQFVLAVSLPMMAGLLVVTDYFVPLFLGDEYQKSITIMYILIPLVIIMGMSSMTGTTVMLAMGLQKRYNTIIVCASMINLILNIILARRFNSLGVAFATIAAEAFVTIAEMLSIKNLIEKRKLLKEASRYTINTILMLIGALVVKQFAPFSWLGIAGIIFAGFAIYSIELVVEKDPLYLVLRNQLIKLK